MSGEAETGGEESGRQEQGKDGFDWTNYEYLKSFSRPVLVLTCIYYGVFNVIVGPITEELFFRGYLTSHYEKQGPLTPVMYVAYRKKNFYISILFHCICNLFSTVSFIWMVLG